MRTVLFGLDGATFTVLEPLVQAGLMPNLRAFFERGVHGPLRSTPIPITPQAWTSMTTGRSAGHHGVHDFIRPAGQGKAVFWRVNDSRSNACPTLWEMVSAAGRRVTTLNFFGMAPPRPLQGHSMPGFTSSRHLRRSCWPEGLLDRVPGLDVSRLGLDYDTERQALQDMEPERWLRWIQHHIEREQELFRLLEHLMVHEPSDLTAVVFDGVDKIQHLAYTFLDPELAPRAPSAWEERVTGLCLDYFRQVDRFLGRTLELIGPWSRVFIASDHGFTASREVVYINTWLHQQGFLHWREAPGTDQTQGLFSERLADLANAFDLERTQAYALTPSCNGLYLRVPPAGYHAFREDLIARLQELRAPDGERVLTAVRRREDSYDGPYLERMPDLILELRDHGFVSVLNGPAPVVPRHHPVGTHHPDGVLLALGPGIRSGERIERADILDVAPLLMHSVGLPIPAEFEGRFREDLYEPAYLAADRPLLLGADEAPAQPEAAADEPGDDAPLDPDEQAMILERLRSLGYVE